ncbi:hypothetical protein STEG23_011445, partial [Scotinomys teguina]
MCSVGEEKMASCLRHLQQMGDLTLPLTNYTTLGRTGLVFRLGSTVELTLLAEVWSPPIIAPRTLSSLSAHGSPMVQMRWFSEIGPVTITVDPKKFQYELRELYVQ